MNCSVGQDLTEDISQDALELYIEAITDAGVEDIKYMNRKTEAIVKLDEIIPFDSEKTCTISERVIKIIPMRTTGKPYVHAGMPFPPTGRATPPTGRATSPIGRATPPIGRDTSPTGRDTSPTGRATPPIGWDTPPTGRATPPTGRATQYQPEKKDEEKPFYSRFRAAEKATPPVVRAEEKSMAPVVRADDEPTAPTVRAEEKSMVSEDSSVAVAVAVTSAGCEDDAKETTECVVGSRAQSQPGSSPKENHIQETVTVAAGKRDLLKMLLPDLQASLPDCTLKTAADGIKVSGPAEAVSQAMYHINIQVFSFKTHIIPLDNQRARLLQSDKSQQQVQELFSKAGIQAVLAVRDDQLLLTAADDQMKEQASSILDRKLCKNEIPVDDFHQEFLQSAEWKQFIDDLERNYTVTVEKGTSSVVIEALGDCSEDVLKQVRDKLDDSAQQSDDIQLTEEDCELLNTYHQSEVEDLG